MLLPYYARDSGNIYLRLETPPSRRLSRPLVLAARLLGALAAIGLCVPLLMDAAHRPPLSIVGSPFSPPVEDFSARVSNRPVADPQSQLLSHHLPSPAPSQSTNDDTPAIPPPPPAPSPAELDLDDPAVAARVSVDALFARQSKTLSQASARYTLRTKRSPPPNYALWFHFAKEHNCLIDDYDQIHRDFKPFYQLAEKHPKYFQEMIGLATKQVRVAFWRHPFAEVVVVDVLNGETSISGYTPYATWQYTFEKFAALLPNMSFILNSRDEPRVAFNFRSPNAPKAALLRKDETPFHISPTPTADFFRAQSGCMLPREADGMFDALNEEHSFLLSSAKPGYTTDLYPVLSMAKVSPCFSDILFPTEYYYDRSWWSGKYEYPDNVSWDAKQSKLCKFSPLLPCFTAADTLSTDWRGKSTGGQIVGTNYRSFPRFRLAELGREHGDIMDVALTQVDALTCREERECNATALAEEYAINSTMAPREEVYNYKYAMDVDGETFSGRFLGLLRSGSLVFKATMFEEYFNGWLRPYEHFIPVRADLGDLVQQLAWAEANPAEARLIQQRGLETARRVVTDEQNDCYYSLVLLEWARLQQYAKTLAEKS
ncbi:CAP10 domain-containing protein [Mycena sanguinolenta]|uniref:CAP10 domain-containing protein n=1 Tax=Mycena sanguinolenta TaxID=230812 RepID=A0A8H6XHE3_9AGAR|nr:CAP10 domain-containing protein [Mycena sanguinolenta]